MKQKYAPILAATVMALGLTSGKVLHGNTKSSSAAMKSASEIQTHGAGTKVEHASASSGSQLTSLLGISIRPAENGKRTTIEISTSGQAAYRIFHLNKPNRLVLDLEGARNRTHRWEFPSGSPLLARIRVGRFSPLYGGVIRIVADLESDPVCRVDREAKGFRIELDPRISPGSGKTLRKVVTGHEPAEPAPSSTPAVRQKLAEGSTPALTTKSGKGPGTHLAGLMDLSHDPVTPAAPDSQASAKSSRPVAMSLALNRRQIPQPASIGKAAKAVAATQDSDVRRVVVPVAERGAPKDGPRFTGKRISLNLKDVDLKDFFRLIHEVSGLNIIVDPDVSGSVTVVLDDVPWDQALALVLGDNGLGDRLEGNVLRIAKISTLTREQEEEEKLNIAREEAAPLVTVFRPVNYAKAATIAALLKTWAGGGALSRRGSVLVDERTNTLIISDIASHIPKIESVIGKLDQKAQQVSIQARIIRTTSDFARDLSTALSFAQRNASGSLVTGGATGNPVSGQPLTPPTVTTASATGFGVFVLSNLGSNYAINAAIAAAETHDQAKTISQPSIVTQNNVEGTVIQGTQIPIQTTINNTISVQYVQASLELKVTPQVTQDGNVFLTIDVQNSSPGPALTFAGPTINTQSATTQVLVPNGGTVIFGGVTVHANSNSSNGIPWFESIPILGHLFKNTSNTRNDQELFFFVTPKILT